MKNAFVKVNRSNMEHFNGELFYVVCYTDAEGKLWGALDPMQYPFSWGFRDITHALKIADEWNSDYDTGRTCAGLAREFSAKETE